MSNIDTTCVNAIRVLAADAIQKANSGHPGLPLGSAAMAYELWANHMNHTAKNPKWANRDRFVLSGGHGSTLLYSLLHFYGYGLTLDDMKQFRQDGSQLPVIHSAGIGGDVAVGEDGGIVGSVDRRNLSTLALERLRDPRGSGEQVERRSGSCGPGCSRCGPCPASAGSSRDQRPWP